MPSSRLQRGQAAVELVAILPFVAAVLALAWQLVLAGHTAWAAQVAARAAARAAAVGADPRTAARHHLPRRLEHGLKVRTREGGRVDVRVRIPAVLPAVELGSAGASARFEPQAAR
jgi:pilus assembly protein CpaE